MYNDFVDIKPNDPPNDYSHVFSGHHHAHHNHHRLNMTILIFVLIAFGNLNIIHHITMIEQLKAVKRNQHDILDALEYMIDTDEK